ncbi:MAG TPA: class I SAM-dependent methyltransferase [Thermoanaerobaculia bacterium]|jgi:SAM-dependent methyltransferase|nr:class I SAM-dependent methyltransferase [Thermoanaerobaculia bacterium]
MPWGTEEHLRFFPNLTWQSNPQIEAVRALVPANARVVDLGSGGRRITERTICVDMLPLPNVNLIADVERLPFRDGSIDLLYATGLLEHVEDDRRVLSEVARILKPGGLVHVELPFLQQYHEDPIDCRRFTVPGLARELQRVGLSTVRSGFHIGPTVTIITLLAYYSALLFEGKNRLGRAMSTLVFVLSSAVLSPLKYLDRFLVGRRSAHRLAFGVYCTSRKG